MIDKTDTQTLDAFPAKKRGRPSTGKALTAAERKRAQRARDMKKIVGEKSPDYASATLTALLEQLPYLIANKRTSQVKAITAEINKRAK